VQVVADILDPQAAQAFGLSKDDVGVPSWAEGRISDIGDGFVARVCAEVQRRLWHPPLEDAADMSRWR
jgi:hypothetical protein